jgi:hypothetical protein
LSFGLAEIVDAASGVRIEVQEWRGLAQEVLEQLHQHDVLQDVGEVAGMEGVSVIQGMAPESSMDFTYRPPPHAPVDGKILILITQYPMARLLLCLTRRRAAGSRVERSGGR